MTVDLKELERLARAATPGEWTTFSLYAEHEVRTAMSELVAIVNNRNDARLIAYANPAAILSLIQELEQARKDAGRYRWISESGLSEVYLHNLPGIDNCKQIGGEGMTTAIDAAIAKEQQFLKEQSC